VEVRVPEQAERALDDGNKRLVTWSAAYLGCGALLAFAAWAGCGSSDDAPPPGSATTAGVGGSGAAVSSGNGELSVGVGGSGGAVGEEPCATASAAVVPSPVDVILTIDQSSSMGEEIAGVVDNINTHLVDVLGSSGIDYRVIFVAGVDGLPSGPEYFQSWAAVNSSDALTLLLWTYDGFYKAPNTCTKIADAVAPWRDQLRFDSHKVFIVVSDDDPSTFDCESAAEACTDECEGCEANCAGYCPMHQCPTYAEGPAAWGGGDFETELYALEPAGMFGSAAERKWVMHAIVPVTQALGPNDAITPLDDVCEDNGNSGVTTGVEYQKLAKLSGGQRFPSCDTDYSPVFESIAATILPLACKFDLEQTGLGTPDPATTNVTVDYGDGQGPQTIPRDEGEPCDEGANGWQYADGGQSIVLCGAACAAVEASSDAEVSITVGCEAVLR
jgi:hypothetical protein